MAYLRYSPRPSDGRQGDALTMEVQRSRIESYAQLYDLVIVEWHRDELVSAKNMEREGLRAALTALDEDRASGLLVAKLDRLTRSVTDMGFLIDNYFGGRFKLFSVGEQIDTRTANGQFAIKLFALVSEWERNKIGERTREALQQLKDKGVTLGRLPLGQKRTGTTADGRRVVEADDEELEIVYRILELRAKGLSLREIANTLTTEQVPTKRGGRWTATTVKRVIDRFKTMEDEH